MEALIKILSNQEQTLRILQNIASYVIYLYPGVTSIYVIDFLEAKSTKETTAFAVKMFAISYVYNMVLDVFIDYTNNIFLYNGILIIISLVVPFGVYKIKYSDFFSCFCSTLGIRTCVTGVPFELIKNDNEDYTCVKIYLSENQYSYIGYMQHYEYEKEMEHFIILTGYQKYILDESGNEKLVLANKRDDCNEKVYIRCSEIKLIEKISEKRADNDIFNNC